MNKNFITACIVFVVKNNKNNISIKKCIMKYKTHVTKQINYFNFYMQTIDVDYMLTLC